MSETYAAKDFNSVSLHRLSIHSLLDNPLLSVFLATARVIDGAEA